MTITVGVIGCGAMGSALVQGWVRNDGRSPRLVVHDRYAEKVDRLVAAAPDVVVAESVVELARQSDLVLVVVKPQDVLDVMTSLSAMIRDEQVVISCVAGLGLERLRAFLGHTGGLFRIMPSLAVRVGEGLVALSAEDGTPAELTAEVQGVFSCLGTVELVPEESLDAVTAVIGSGMAFLALALEGMEDGAVRAGMPRQLARVFVRHTALGAARLLAESGDSAAELKDQVSSPGGTTIAGIAILEDRGVRGAFLRAVEAAAARGFELGEES